MYISCTHLSDQIVVCIVYATLCYANDRKYCKCTITLMVETEILQADFHKKRY